MSNIDDERIKKYLGSVEERINFNKENGCKLLDCKVIDENIKLRLENIKLKKIAEKLASVTYDYANLEMLNICPAEYEGKVDLRKCKQNHIERNCIQCIIDWARKEVNNGNNSSSSN